MLIRSLFLFKKGAFYFSVEKKDAFVTEVFALIFLKKIFSPSEKWVLFLVFS